jgi:hypothetical protein
VLVVIGKPQSSTTFTAMVCGQPAGTLPPDPSSVKIGCNWLGHAVCASRGASPLAGEADPLGATTVRTLTVLALPSLNWSVIVFRKKVAGGRIVVRLRGRVADLDILRTGCGGGEAGEDQSCRPQFRAKRGLSEERTLSTTETDCGELD